MDVIKKQNQNSNLKMKKNKKYIITFTDGTKCTVKAVNKQGKEIRAGGAAEYAEQIHGKKMMQIEIVW